MKLNPDLIRRLKRAAKSYGDNPFFAVWMKDHWFVFNWTFGLTFYDREILNCPHFESLRRYADVVLGIEEPKTQLEFDFFKGSQAMQNRERDVLRNLIEGQNWLDMFAGRAGIYMDMNEVDMQIDEECIFPKDWAMMAWESHSGQRYYMKSNYFAVAEEVIGELRTSVYRPINDAVSPAGYRPFIFQDDQSRIRGLLLSTMVAAPEEHRQRGRKRGKPRV